MNELIYESLLYTWAETQRGEVNIGHQAKQGV